MAREGFTNDPDTMTRFVKVTYHNPDSRKALLVGWELNPLTRFQVMSTAPGFVAKTTRAFGLQ
jgi:hypothetical protein